VRRHLREPPDLRASVAEGAYDGRPGEMASRLDKIDVIEAAYRLDEPDDEAWIGQLGRTFSAASGLGTSVAFTYEFVGDRIRQGATWDERVRGLIDLEAAHANMPRDQHDIMYGRALMAGLLSERLEAIGVAIEEAPAWGAIRAVGGHDLFGFPGIDLDGHGVAISGVIGQKRLRPEDMHTWSCVAAHVACAHRLRRALASAPVIDRAAAVFSPDGVLEHAEDEAALSARERLREAVGQIDRARRVGIDEQEACKLWQGLVEGRWSIVDHFTGGGRRHYVVVHNPPEAQPLRGLTRDEETALGYVIGGTSNKIAAYALGRSESAYSRLTVRAMNKLGVSSRAALIELASRLDAPRAGDEVDVRALEIGGVEIPVVTAPPLPFPASFTAAEREVAQLLFDGKSSVEIAGARATSPRTVANQLASIYRKCGVSTREELTAALVGRDRPR
jgi:DNA-binding NarL/FixJ family response regulator